MLLNFDPENPVKGRRVVVTGVGTVTCSGIESDVFWHELLTASAPSSRRVPDFDASHLGNPKELRRLDPFALYGLAAAQAAWEQAQLPSTVPDGACVIATGIGGLQTLTEQLDVLHTRGAQRVSPFMIPMMMPNAASAAVSMRFGLTGPCETITTACAAGTHAIGYAARLVASGRVPLAVAGGAEAVMTPIAEAGFTNMTALSSTGVSRPFDALRDGFVMGEGAGVLILEDRDHAISRGATILAEIVGAASTADAHHLTAPNPDGIGAIECIRAALHDAGLQPSDISHINAHGTSTPLNDAAEARALRAVFGATCPPVTSVKGFTGHALAAAGAIEAVVSVLTVLHQIAPPTAGTVTIDENIDLPIILGEGLNLSVDYVLSNSFGFGGHNGCLIIGRP